MEAMYIDYPASMLENLTAAWWWINTAEIMEISEILEILATPAIQATQAIVE